jgi:glycopeptide antibiotics resistance protein
MTTTVPARQDTAASGSRSDTRRLAALFAVYLVLLVWVVLWKLELPWVGDATERIVKLVPFVPSGGAGASTPSEVVVNVALFVPLGLYLGLLVPSWPWWKVAASVAGVSTALELTQYVLAVGSSDVTDVLVNTAGGLAGLALLALARRRFRGRTVRVMTRVCSVATVLAVLACAIVVVSPLRYAAPEDVWCGPTSRPPGPGERPSLSASDAGNPQPPTICR